MPGRDAVCGRGTPRRPAGSPDAPTMYGFSTSLTSIAVPYACADQRAGPAATARRQLNADVLSAAADRSSLPP